MSKCEFVYEMAILRCQTHDCTIVGVRTPAEEVMCIIGRVEALEERVVRLERPTTVPTIDELGNPFSLRIPTKPE
jgi:hypothetical protein